MTKIIKLIKKLLRTTRTRKNKKTVHSQHIIPRSQHQVSKTDISVNALKVLNRLASAGYEAYLVGGSVRDLLLRKSPKDFDVATNATPNQIRNLFKNARVIGRRFKLVHIVFHREIIEVATFRGHEPTGSDQLTNERGMLVRDNVYGTLEEDAWRRDFSVNSLYYNAENSTIVDFTGGFSDINKKQIRVIGDPVVRYQEDPVRMLRAIRFGAKLHFDFSPETQQPLDKFSHLILHVSNSRLFDEMIKLYQCGEAETVQQLLMQYGFFAHLFSQTHHLLDTQYPVKALLGIALQNTDIRVRDDKPVNPAFLFAIFLWFPLLECAKQFVAAGEEPLPALEMAMSQVLAIQNKTVMIPKRYTQVMREIWLIQYRLPKRTGNRAYHLLEHPRFRAAYDFLAIRALAGDESMELADWWTQFQDVDADEQARMVAEIAATSPPVPTKKRRRRSRSKAPKTES